ncbi:MAG: hypothetical protein K5776_11765 [Lachnospiraceae bacterium]|nr:hypothetical protein [Lachnospiraceae bacterium]
MADFIFCPRCGAVTKPGICSNCGYKMEEYVSENVESEVNVNAESEQTAPKIKKSSGNGWIIGLIVGIVLMLFLVIFSGILVVIGIMPLAFKTITSTSHPTVQAVPNPPTNNNLPNIPDVKENEEDEKDNENKDEDGKENDETKEEEEPLTIRPYDPDDSVFDYDKFSDEIISGSNEFWDENKGDDDLFVHGNYSAYSQSGSSHDFADRDSFTTPYYNYIINSYVENENYDVERRTIRYEGEVNGVYYNAYCGYYTLSADNVDFTAVNEGLRNKCLERIEDYIRNSTDAAGTYVTIYVDSVVTFNNDDVFSAAYDTNVYSNNVINTFSISSVNIDVKNAAVMDNTKILTLDDDFSKFFIERSNTQNRWVESINKSDVSDVTKVFNDDDSLILFFTPLGVEVGINYKYRQDSYGSDYVGWVTITLNDFDNYLSGTYNFNADWGKNYDIYQYEKDNNITPSSGYEFDYDYDSILYDL